MQWLKQENILVQMGCTFPPAAKGSEK